MFNVARYRGLSGLPEFHYKHLIFFFLIYKTSFDSAIVNSKVMSY